MIIQTQLLEYIVVELKCNKRNILLVSCYRPPNTNVEHFIKEYKSMMKILRAQKEHEVVIGLDHNLDLLKYHISSPTHKFLDLNLDADLLPSITMPTRVTKSSATLIDNLFISRKLQYSYESHIILDDLSDHLACLTIIKGLTIVKRGKEIQTIRNLSPKNTSNMNEKLAEINWEGILQNKTTEESFNCFHSKLTQILDEVSPEMHKIINTKRIPIDPWMTKGILNSLARQKALYLEQLNSSTELKVLKYKSYRNQLKKIIRKSKQTYYLNKCKAFKQDSRKLWNLINCTLNNKENKENSIECLRINGTTKYNAQSITTEFCNHFATVGENFANKLPTPRVPINKYIDRITRSEYSIFLTPTSKTEINELIKELPNKKSSGHDSISNTLLKALSPSLLVPLEIIFNKSLSEGHFPSIMKRADIIPLYKAKQHDDSNNYRPISLLLTISVALLANKPM